MTCTLKTNLVQLSRLILMRVLSSNSPLPAFSTCTIKLNFNNLSRLIQIELSNSCLHIFYVSCTIDFNVVLLSRFSADSGRVKQRCFYPPSLWPMLKPNLVPSLNWLTSGRAPLLELHRLSLWTSLKLSLELNLTTWNGGKLSGSSFALRNGIFNHEHGPSSIVYNIS